jgi:SAM-dependent methyltransferase
MSKSAIPRTDYSEIAKYYDSVRLVPTEELLSRIVEYGKIDRSSAVLDVGCGTGRFTLGISSAKPFRLLALEPSIEMLKRATLKDEPKRILWIRGDGQYLPFRDCFLDCVYMTSVIHHIENKKMALQEIYRVLKEGGSCVIMTYSHSGIKKQVIHDFPGVTAIDLKRIPSVPCLKEIMGAVGFRDISYHAIMHDEGYTSVDEYLERVRKKYLSTLTLLNENAFQRGFKVFEERLRKKYGDQMKKISRFVIIAGQKRAL